MSEDKIVAWICKYDDEITDSLGLAENWKIHGYIVEPLTEYQFTKAKELEVVKKLINLAAPSLDPDSFIDLEKILAKLCKNRHLELDA